MLAAIIGLAVAATPVPQWETRCSVQPAARNAQELSATLEELANSRGAEGWLLTGIVPASSRRGPLTVCFTRPKGGIWPGALPGVTRVPADHPVDLSGRFNDVDARLLTEGLVQDCLEQLQKRLAGQDGTVALKFRDLVNKTSEHIDMSPLASGIEQGLSRVSQIRVVGKDAAADWVAILRLGSIVDQVEGQSLRTYVGNLDILDAATGEKTCIAVGQIKKVVERPKTQW